MRLGVIVFLTVAVSGCSASSSGSSPQGGGDDAGTDDAANDAGDAGAEASAGPTPVWTAFAARGSDARWGVPVAYASKEKAFVGFAGALALAGVSDGTFAMSTADGTWTKLADTGEPAPRYCGCTTYLPDQDQVLLIGGFDGNPLPAGAWTLDMATGAWKAVGGPVPTGIIGCATAYVASRGKAFVFGGLSPTAFLAETWSYDPVAAAFTKLAPPSAPSARADAIAAYDPGEGGRMLIFAGTANETTNTGHDNDLWAFDGTSWTKLAPAGGPPPVRRVAAGGFDPVRRRWVIFGGTVETKDSGDLWLLDVPSMTWTELPGNGAPSARGFASSGYDPVSDSYFVVGGLQQPKLDALSDGWKLQLQ